MCKAMDDVPLPAVDYFGWETALVNSYIKQLRKIGNKRYLHIFRC